MKQHVGFKKFQVSSANSSFGSKRLHYLKEVIETMTVVFQERHANDPELCDAWKALLTVSSKTLFDTLAQTQLSFDSTKYL
ncbi:unnamed protein product [Soboliphyme baturini]|uniref:GLOBIN domain-containing protein n=1 Tax=Soboliphyme baturini TaxID=241478 RepID=A0A183IYC7_9BILA|nr:unnamed protein product [Soboliphyme baturini]